MLLFQAEVTPGEPYPRPIMSWTATVYQPAFSRLAPPDKVRMREAWPAPRSIRPADETLWRASGFRAERERLRLRAAEVRRQRTK